MFLNIQELIIALDQLKIYIKPRTMKNYKFMTFLRLKVPVLFFTHFA